MPDQRTTHGDPLADLIGPMYSTESVASLIGCPVVDLEARQHAGQLLGMRTADGIGVYPRFQFAPSGQVRAELLPILRLFGGLPSWSTGAWLRTSNEDLGNATPEGWLAAGGDPAVVEQLASATAHQWGQ